MTNSDQINDPLSGLRLLTALDALLVEGSVGGAARRLGISAPAMSRLLAQIRAHYDDPIVVRRGGRLIPTPFVEALRIRLRALVVEADALLTSPGTSQDAEIAAPLPLAGFPHTLPLTRADAVDGLEGAPNPDVVARKLLDAGRVNDPALRFARHIAVVAGGLGRSRPLSDIEAEEVVAIMLEGAAHPIQLGAMLMALHHRGTTAKELANFVFAARRHAGVIATPSADLDWPVYQSPRNRTPPWYLHAARLVAASGVRVCLHGTEDPRSTLKDALDLARITRAKSVEEAAAGLRSQDLIFLPLRFISAQLQAMFQLYGLFELRTVVHQIVSLLNPLSAPATLVGVPGTTHRELPRDAAALIGTRDFACTANHRDVAQATPFKASTLFRLVEGEPHDTHLPSALQAKPMRYPHFSSLEVWQGLWDGTIRDGNAEKIVIETAAIALMTAGQGKDLESARAHATALWSKRLA